MINDYKTVKNNIYDAEYVIKKSRFLAHVKYVETREEAEDFISEIKQKHSGARHNTHAYRIKNQNIMHQSDDGEPSGTAGTPIMDVILKQELYNIVIVVTRYFGGILLGAGGLVRAYGTSAAIGIEKSGRIIKKICDVGEIECSYELYAKIKNIAEKNDCKIKDEEFAESVKFRVVIPGGALKKLQDEIVELSAGKVECSITGKEYESFDVE